MVKWLREKVTTIRVARGNVSFYDASTVRQHFSNEDRLHLTDEWFSFSRQMANGVRVSRVLM